MGKSQNENSQSDVAEKTKKPDFGQNLLLLVIGFVLTGLIGSYVSYRFQNRTAINQYNISLIEAERNTGKSIFEDVMKGLDSRVYCSQLVCDNYIFHPNTGVEEKIWQQYVIQMNDWNENINKRRSLVGLYFGKKTETEVAKMHVEFMNLNHGLNLIKKGNNFSAYHSDANQIDVLKTNKFMKLAKL